MRGFVPTPESLVDRMVARLFLGKPPEEGTRVLDPGCGDGEFIAGLLRACERHRWPVPKITGVELHPERAAAARARFATEARVTIEERDFLKADSATYDAVIGNPPYVSILSLSVSEKSDYRTRFVTARGRFDLYVLFFEQALSQLRPGGRLVFVTPEKFLYVQSARPLRALLASHEVEHLEFASEDTFEGLVTYPLITTVRKSASTGSGVSVRRRDGGELKTGSLGADSWLPEILGHAPAAADFTLTAVSRRISCGVATGADEVFVQPLKTLPAPLRRFAHPTIAGRQLSGSALPVPESVLLAPYDPRGLLLEESELGALGDYLADSGRRNSLAKRTCSARKPWYAFHDSLPLDDLLRPKLLCKDITPKPQFVVDAKGTIVPRHSVYYIVPVDSALLEPLAEYLNSPTAHDWLQSHCQRAANGFLRLQSHVLKRLPLPDKFLPWRIASVRRGPAEAIPA